MIKLLLGMILMSSLPAFGETQAPQNDLVIVMKYKTIIQRNYPNSMYNTPSLEAQCNGLKGILLKSIERVSEPFSISAAVGICKHPEIVEKASLKNEVGNQKNTSFVVIYQAVATLRFANGSFLSETIESKCRSRGGELIDKTYASIGGGWETLAYGGVCKITVDTNE